MQERIRKLMEAQHMNQQAFANHTGIATASLSNIFSGRTRPTLMHVEALMKSFPTLNLQWLINGSGTMFANSPSGSSVPGTSAHVEQGNLFSDQPEGDAQDLGASSNGGHGSGSTDKMAEPLSLFAEESPAKNIGQNFGTQKDTRQNPAFSHQNSAQRGSYMQTSSPAIASVAPIQVQRKITEIRVFYDDQTWESFVPKK